MTATTMTTEGYSDSDISHADISHETPSRALPPPALTPYSFRHQCRRYSTSQTSGRVSGSRSSPSLASIPFSQYDQSHHTVYCVCRETPRFSVDLQPCTAGTILTCFTTTEPSFYTSASLPTVWCQHLTLIFPVSPPTSPGRSAVHRVEEFRTPSLISCTTIFRVCGGRSHSRSELLFPFDLSCTQLLTYLVAQLETRSASNGPGPRNHQSGQASANDTTMPHRALVVEEILREVVTHVTNTHHPAAISLACSARFLEEPVLSALWKKQDSLQTLIRTLPPDSWVMIPPASRGPAKIVCDSPHLQLPFTLVSNVGYGIGTHSNSIA